MSDENWQFNADGTILPLSEAAKEQTRAMLRIIADKADAAAASLPTMPVLDDGREAAFTKWFTSFSADWKAKSRTDSQRAFWRRIFLAGWDAAQDRSKP